MIYTLEQIKNITCQLPKINGGNKIYSRHCTLDLALSALKYLFMTLLLFNRSIRTRGARVIEGKESNRDV